MIRRRFVALAFLVAAAQAALRTASAQTLCGDLIEPAGISASDGLVVLGTAVALERCSLCACDTDGSGLMAATDSLLTLKAAVGQAVTLACPFCCEHCECSPRKRGIYHVELRNDEAAARSVGRTPPSEPPYQTWPDLRPSQAPPDPGWGVQPCRREAVPRLRHVS